MTKAPEKSAKSQRQRFIEAAREVGADEDEGRFERRLKSVAGGNSSTGAKKSAKRQKK